MIIADLATHTEVLGKTGTKFYMKGATNLVWATFVAQSDGVIYRCITDEDPARALPANSNLLNQATQINGIEFTH
jgi:hypothetical protein